MANYRSSVDIIADILKVALENEGAKKTQIMYGANLSYRLLTKYLDYVVRAGLLAFGEDGQRFRLTSKGNDFLKVYKDYSKRSRRVQRQISDLNDKKKRLISFCRR